MRRLACTPGNLNGFLLCALLIWSGMSFGQIRSGVITGRVVDQSDAPVVAAQVTVVAPETNAQFHVLTNVGGEYIVPYLPAGQYSVRVAATGFATSQITDIYRICLPG